MAAVNLSGKEIYVVLGFARSGTSTIARSLKALGIDLGDRLTEANDKWNKKGFWEDKDIVYKVNAGVFAALDEPLYSIPFISADRQRSPDLDSVKDDAIELLKEKFSTNRRWGFKDPSTLKILYFWQKVFAESKLNAHYVFALRHPLSSALSYQRLTGTPLEVGLLLWLTHLMAGAEATLNASPVFVSYELMLEAPQIQLHRLANNLQIPINNNDPEIKLFVENFLDNKLNRHGTHDMQAEETLKDFSLCMAAYELFMQVARDEIRFGSDEFLNKWEILNIEFKKAYPLYCYLDKVLRKNKLLEQNNKRLEKSLVGKLLYPLQFIDNKLRLVREKKRAKKRIIKAYS